MKEFKLCTGIGCKQKSTCTRFITPPEEFAEFFTMPPWTDDGEKCIYYAKHEPDVYPYAVYTMMEDPD